MTDEEKQQLELAGYSPEQIAEVMTHRRERCLAIEMMRDAIAYLRESNALLFPDKKPPQPEKAAAKPFIVRRSA